MSRSLATQILAYAATLPAGAILQPKGLLHLGTRAAVDQALSRLARSGELLRLGRGVYARPVTTAFGTRSPGVEQVVQAIAESHGETVVPTGAAEANALGLTTQVPVRQVFLTSGRTRRLTLGAQTVELRHAPTWLLYAPNRPAGRAIRALHALGAREATQHAAEAYAKLTPEARAEVLQVRASLPTWLAMSVSAVFTAAARG